MLENISAPYTIKAVLFDFDGTLTVPGALDFAEFKKSTGCPRDMPVLEYLETLDSKVKKEDIKNRLDQFEAHAAEMSQPHEGAEELIRFLRSKQIPLGIVTRNRRASIDRALENFSEIRARDFDLIITRDDPVAFKPSPDAVLLAARRFGVKPAEILLVGDYIFDIQAGLNAGCLTAFLDNQTFTDPTESDFTVRNLGELKNIIRMGMRLGAGKLPNDLLEMFLRQFDFQDPSVLMPPGVGEDVTVVKTGAKLAMVLKTDPITFITDNFGRYAVLINANDIATCGAVPRWMLTSLLFPVKTTPSRIRQVMEDLYRACLQSDITLCGGHTEITDAVTRPVVTGMMVGVVEKSGLIKKQDMKPGDRVLLTKAVAVEGSAIIASEFESRLLELGLKPDEIESAQKLVSRLSILKEARIAANSGMVTAMHDITEGGIATALSELSIAGGHEIEVDMDRIAHFEITRKICRLLRIDPLGLIGSGSLLICCKPEGSESLMVKIRQAGIRITQIGKVGASGKAVRASRDGKPCPWPEFEADQLTLLF